MNIFLLYIAHSLAWFCLASLGAVWRGHGGTMRLWSAAAVGIVSATLHVILKHLGYISL